MNKICPSCGNVLRESDKFCNECGANTKTIDTDTDFDIPTETDFDTTDISDEPVIIEPLDSESDEEYSYDEEGIYEEAIEEFPSDSDYDYSNIEYQSRMAQKNSGKSNTKIIILIIMLLVAGACVFVYFNFFANKDKPTNETTTPVTETTPAAIEEKPETSEADTEKVNKEIISDIGFTLEQLNTIYGEVIWNEYFSGGLGFVFENGHGMYFFDDYKECYAIDGVSPSDLFSGLPGESSANEVATEYGLNYDDTYYSELEDAYVSVFSYDKYSIKITTEKEGVITIDSAIFLSSEKFAAVQQGE